MPRSTTRAHLLAENATLRARVAELEAALPAAGRPDHLTGLAVSIVNTMPAVIYIYDLERRCNVYANDGLTRVLGYAAETVQALGAQLFARLIHPDDLSAVQAGEAQLLAARDRQVLEMEYRARHQDGAWRILHTYESPFQRNPDGSLKLKIGVAIDVTERRQAEAARQASDARYRALFDGAEDGIFVVQPDGICREVNPSGLRLLGLDRAAVVGRPIAGVVLDTERPRLSPEAAEVQAGGPYRREWQFQRPDGALFTGEVLGTALPDGNLLGIVRDVTERRRVEAALRESEQRYELLFQKSAVPTVLLRLPEVVIVDANDAAETLTGFTRQEMRGRTAVELGLSQPAERERGLAQFERHGALLGLEIRLVTKSGAERVALVNTIPVHLGTRPHAISTLQDITERRRAEAAVRQSRAQFIQTFDANPAALVITRQADGKFIRINAAYTRLIGYLSGEIVGRLAGQVEIYANPDDRAVITQLVRAHGRLRDHEVLVRAKSGALRHMLVYVEPLDFDGEACFLSALLDITERKHAEQAARMTGERLRQLFNLGPVAKTLVRAVDHVVVDLNAAAEQLFGYSRAELIGHPVDHRYWVDAAERQRAFALFAQQGFIRGFDFQYRAKTGEVGWVSIFAEVMEQDGERYFLSEFVNLTAVKRVEADLRVSRDRLVELSRRLVEAREREARAIARELHDEIGQSLTALQITLDLAPQVAAERRPALLARAQHLTAELLDKVSQLSQGLRPPMLDDLGLLPALLWLVERFQEQSGLPIDLRYVGPEGRRFPPEIEMTAYRFVQEALTNVARHAHGTRVRVWLQAGEADLRVQIDDDGQGFDQAAALAQNRGLSGLHERVDLVAGQFQIESQPGRGTRLTALLPLQGADA